MLYIRWYQLSKLIGLEIKEQKYNNMETETVLKEAFNYKIIIEQHISKDVIKVFVL